MEARFALMVVGASDASQPTVQLPNHLAATKEKEGILPPRKLLPYVLGNVPFEQKMAP